MLRCALHAALRHAVLRPACCAAITPLRWTGPAAGPGRRAPRTAPGWRCQSRRAGRGRSGRPAGNGGCQQSRRLRECVNKAAGWLAALTRCLIPRRRVWHWASSTRGYAPCQQTRVEPVLNPLPKTRFEPLQSHLEEGGQHALQAQQHQANHAGHRVRAAPHALALRGKKPGTKCGPIFSVAHAHAHAYGAVQRAPQASAPRRQQPPATCQPQCRPPTCMSMDMEPPSAPSAKKMVMPIASCRIERWRNK